MAKFDKNEILGNIIPNAYIRKIVLETTIGDVFQERNPHIDSAREPGLTIDANGKLVYEKVDFDLSKKDDSAEPMKITLEIVMKEMLDDSLLSSWFNELDLLKYMKIIIVPSQRKERTKDIMLKSERIHSKHFGGKIIDVKEKFKDNKDIEQYEKYTDDDGNEIHNISFTESFTIPTSDPEHLAFFIMPYLDIKQIAKDYSMDLGSSADEFQTLDGKLIGDLVIDDKTIVSESYIFVLEDGTIWTGSVHVLKKENNNVIFRTGENEDADSKDLQVKTIPNAKVQDFRNVKEIEKLQLDFSFLEDKVRGVQNNNIKFLNNDYLDVQKKSSYFTDLFLTRDFNGATRFLFGIDYLRLAQENTLFGKLYNNKNALEILKNVRIKSMRIIRNRSSNSLTTIVDENGLTYFDRDVEPVENVVFSNGDDENGFLKNPEINDKGDIREVSLHFLQPSDKRVRHFTGIDKEMGERKIDNKTLSGISFGSYQYGVEIDLEDKTNNFLLGLIDNLTGYYNSLKEYNNEAMSYFVSDGPPIYIDNPHITSDREGPVKSRKINTATDVVTNKFTSRFIEEQKKKYSNNPKMAPWAIVPIGYANVLDMLFEEVNAENVIYNLTLLMHPKTGNVSGVQAILDSMETFMTKLSDIAGVSITNEAQKFVKDQKVTKPDTMKTRSGSSSPRIVKIQKFFNNIIDSDVAKNVGYDFLSFEESDNDDPNIGLKIIASNKFKERAKQEEKKYFNPNAVESGVVKIKIRYSSEVIEDNLEKTKYTYFAPARAKIGTFSVPIIFDKINEDIPNAQKYTDFCISAIAYNNLKKSPQIKSQPFSTDPKDKRTTKQQRVADYSSNSLFEKNVLVMNNVDAFAQRFLDHNEPAASSQNSDDIVSSKGAMGTLSKFNTEDPKKSEVGTKQSAQIFSETNTLQLSLMGSSMIIKNQNIEKDKMDEQLIGVSSNFDLNNQSNAVGREADYYKTTMGDIMSLLPIAIKSLFVNSVSPNLVNIDWFKEDKNGVKLYDNSDQKFVLDMNYRIINKIEALIGYKSSAYEGGVLLIKDPIWGLLTAEIINSAVGRSVLCRQVEYTERQFDIGIPKQLRLPVVNQFFILNPTKEIILSVEGGEKKGLRMFDISEKMESSIIEAYEVGSSIFEASLTKDSAILYDASRKANETKTVAEQADISKSAIRATVKQNVGNIPNIRKPGVR